MEKEWFGTFGTSYSCSKKKNETEPGPHTGYKSVPTDWCLKCERQNCKTKKINVGKFFELWGRKAFIH